MANKLLYDTNTLDSIANKINRLSSDLQQSKNTISGIASAIDKKSGAQLHFGSSSYFSMASMRAGNDDIKSCLQQYARVLERYSSISTKLSGNVRKVSDLVSETENRLTNYITQSGEAGPFANGGNSAGSGSSGNSSAGGSGNSPSSNEKFDFQKLLLDIISKAGSGGSFLSGILGMFKDDFNLESIMKFAVRSGDSVIKWVKALKSSDQPFYKQLFGLTDYLTDPSTAKNTWTAFKSNFGTGFKKGMSNKASWLTAAIGSAFDNYEEFGGKITDRCVVEWATETATSVTLGAATTALAGAGLAALGVVNAPVLLVGAAGVVIYSGADALWKNTLGDGKSITQSVGNFVGNVYDGAKEGLGKAADWLGDKIDGIKNGWNISALWA